MNTSADLNNNKFPAIKALALAIAAISAISASLSHAGPTGGTVIDGGGNISQSGNTTRIDQNTDRLSLQWDTFDVATDERVEFVQPSHNSTALNRIMDNNGSRILGQIDANGHVILMNPNGIFFGQNATVNVGGLVASGLNINSDDFMNGDLAFAGIDGSAGTVVNRGLINAATGGNVALLGKSVANHGLISANLGHVALVAGSEAVVTFDDQGLIGVRIDKETLAQEAGSAAVNNSGSVSASGGKILLNASVSADLFSQAVNRGDLNDTTSAIVHNDGSFTLGAGNHVVNSGSLDVSTDSSSSADAGHVVLAGNTVNHRGKILADAESNNAGSVYAQASEDLQLGAYSRIEASSNATASGKISINASDAIADAGARVNTTGGVLVSAYEHIRLPTLNANQLYLQGIGDIEQSGAASVSGNTHLNVLSEADAQLVQAENDFNSLSLDTEYTAFVRVRDKNNLVLNDINISDSSLHIELPGSGATLSQNSDTLLDVSYGSFTAAAENVQLGENNSSTHIRYGLLDLTFGGQINTRDSISFADDGGLMASTAVITGEVFGSTALTLTAQQNVNIDAKLTEETLTINGMTGDEAELNGLFDTTQTGPIHLSDALTWNSYNAVLEHTENDIAALQGRGAIAFGQLKYVDKNNVVLRDLDTVTENSVSITALGTNSKIEQAADSVLAADFIELDAANIFLGANGTSEVHAGYVLEMDFSKQAHINGRFEVGSGWYAPLLRISGDSGNNRFTFGPHASNSSFARDGLLGSIDIDFGAGNDTAIFDSEFSVGDDEWSSYSFNMGAGNDLLLLRNSMTIPVNLGAGRDTAMVWYPGVDYDLTDFDARQDRLLRIRRQ